MNKKKIDLPFNAVQALEDIKEYKKNPTIELRNKCIVDNLRLVSFIAYKYSIVTGIDIKELNSYGYEGLIYAVVNYDLDRNNSFSSYAFPCIKGFILKGIASMNGFNNANYYKYLNSKHEVMNNKKNISIEEEINNIVDLMSEDDNWSEKRKKFNKNRILCNMTESLDEYNDSLICNMDLYHNIISSELEETIDRGFSSKLKDIEVTILKGLFGLGNNEFKSLSDLSHELNISKENIIVIRNKAFRKLSLWDTQNHHKLRDYMDEYNKYNYSENKSYIRTK